MIDQNLKKSFILTAENREKDRMGSELQRMKEVIAEVVSENIALKKKNIM